MGMRLAVLSNAGGCIQRELRMWLANDPYYNIELIGVDF